MPSFVIQQLTLVEADQHLQLEIIFYAAKSLHHSFIAVFSLGLSGPPRPNQGELGMAGFCHRHALCQILWRSSAYAFVRAGR